MWCCVKISLFKYLIANATLYTLYLILLFSYYDTFHTHAGFRWYSSWPIFTISNIIFLNVIELADNNFYGRCSPYNSAKLLHLCFLFHNFVALVTNLLLMFRLVEVDLRIIQEGFNLTMTFLVLHLVLIQIENQVITLYQQIRFSSPESYDEHNCSTL